jgi:nucleoid-associated protein EbfC
MFEDIFGNVQKQQQELQQRLAQIIVEAEAGDDAITVRAGGDLHIENTDREQLEDLLVVAVNRALELARQKAAEESAKSLQDMFPMGGDMGQLLKGLGQ